MKHKNPLILLLILGAVFSASTWANDADAEQNDSALESSLNLNDGASQESLGRLIKKMPKKTWEMPEFIEKAVEKIKKRRKQAQEDYWGDYSGYGYGGYDETGFYNRDYNDSDYSNDNEKF